MDRRANRIPPKAGEPRKRCTRGWRGQSCKKRTCEVCGVVWARDWRRVLFEALQAPGVPVVLSAVTPPGVGELPWDEWHCAHRGPHITARGSAVGSTARRWRRGRGISRSGGSGSTMRLGTRASGTWGGVCRLRRGRGNRRREGRGMCTRSSTSTPQRMSGSSSAISRTWRGWPRGMGSASWAASAARACSSCRATERRRTRRATSCVARDRRRRSQENARNPHLPRMLIWVLRPYALDGCHDAQPASLQAALGRKDGPDSSAVVVRRRTRSDCGASRSLARART